MKMLTDRLLAEILYHLPIIIAITSIAVFVTICLAMVK